MQYKDVERQASKRDVIKDPLNITFSEAEFLGSESSKNRKRVAIGPSKLKKESESATNVAGFSDKDTPSGMKRKMRVTERQTNKEEQELDSPTRRINLQINANKRKGEMTVQRGIGMGNDIKTALL